MQSLLQMATDLGLRVEWSAAMGDHLRAVYEDATRTITVNSALTHAQARSALAHELGHARFGHRASGNTHDDVAMERAADEFAAALLIDRSAYAQAERLVGPHPGALARELEVTADIVAAWQAMLR